jgi:hypothetical protein
VKKKLKARLRAVIIGVLFTFMLLAIAPGFGSQATQPQPLKLFQSSPVIYAFGSNLSDQLLTQLGCKRIYFLQVPSTDSGLFDWTFTEKQLAIVPAYSMVVPDWESGLMRHATFMSEKTYLGVDAEISLLKKCRARRTSCKFGLYARPSVRNQYAVDAIAFDRIVAGMNWAVLRHAHFVTAQCYRPSGGANNPYYVKHILSSAIDAACGKPVYAVVTPRHIGEKFLSDISDDDQISWYIECLNARGLHFPETRIAGFIIWQSGNWYRLKSLDDPNSAQAQADPELKHAIISSRETWGDLYVKHPELIESDAINDVKRCAANISKAITSMENPE